jgi:hypothetical protein
LSARSKTRKGRQPKAEAVAQVAPVAPVVAKAVVPANDVAMGGGARLASARIGGSSPVIGSVTIGGAACTSA